MRFLIIATLALAGLFSGHGDANATSQQDDARPNIVLIVFEDMGQRIGAFGDPVAVTPVLDAFAEEAIRYPNTFTTAGVCSPSRAALMTGHHQMAIGAQHMRARSAPGYGADGLISYDVVPPESVKAFPELLRAAGYFTTNNAKTDYQFGTPFTVWDIAEPVSLFGPSDTFAHWRERDPGQPFFSMITLMQTHESYIWPTTPGSISLIQALLAFRNWIELSGQTEQVTPDDVAVPPYLPDTPEMRRDLAQHYNNITFQEIAITRILDQLQDDGLLDNTIILVTTDHGDGLPRMKRTVYDSGIRVPLMIRYPDGTGAGTVDERLVSFADLAPTLLTWAHAEVPGDLPGKPISTASGEALSSRDYIFAAADRHDTLPDRYRAVRDHRYKLIRNFQPEHPFFRPLPFRDVQPGMQSFWTELEAGTLTPIQQSYFDAPRPEFELYDIENDPHEVTNLAGTVQVADVEKRLSDRLDSWLNFTGDRSREPEMEMVATMWPDLEQPATEVPLIDLQSLSDGAALATISSATPGASIGFRYASDPEGRWHLYTEPFTVPPDASQLSAKAIRYGYLESDIATVTLR